MSLNILGLMFSIDYTGNQSSVAMLKDYGRHNC